MRDVRDHGCVLSGQLCTRSKDGVTVCLESTVTSRQYRQCHTELIGHRQLSRSGHLTVKLREVEPSASEESETKF